MNFSQFINALAPRFRLTVFGREPKLDFPGHGVSESHLARFIDAIPLLRRRSDVRDHLSNTHFDRYVAKRVPSTDVFHGVTGQCLRSLQRAHYLGARTVLDCITTHVDDFLEQQREEGRRFGIRPTLSDSSRDMALAEYAFADVIRVMSDYAKQTLVDRGIPERKIYVVRPPLAIDSFPIANFDEPRFRVSFVGMLVPAKGFHYLLDAFRGIPDADAELVLWSGSGHRPINRYMKEQIAEDPRIQMRPISVRDNYAEVYGKSNVLVHPSLSDGYSYAVMEAMASGIPVIVTSCTGASELIRDGENGYVVPPRDPGAIRERLLYLLRHPEVVRRMGKAAKETIQSQHPQDFSDRYAEVIEALIAKEVPCTA